MGELRQYWIQNSPSDFQAIVTKFIEWLHARGHVINNLLPLFLQVATALDSFATNRQGPDLRTQNSLYIHWTHHPKGIQRSDICQLYNQTLEPHGIHDTMTVAMSRPKNLRDILTRTALILPEGKSIQGYLKEQATNT
jgi:hypothetical protein